MTNVVTNMIPDGIAAAPGLVFESEPTTGLYKKAGGKIGIAVAGVEVGELSANGLAGGVQVASLLFQAAGAHVFTGTIPLPAGSLIIDVGVYGLVLWNAATSASLIVGDDTTPNGFYTATDLKATDLLAFEANTIQHPGGLAGAYIVSEQRKLYSASARNVVAVVTQVGAGNAGTTLVVVQYAVPTAIAPVVTS
jgi:hypothetical protein